MKFKNQTRIYTNEERLKQGKRNIHENPHIFFTSYLEHNDRATATIYKHQKFPTITITHFPGEKINLRGINPRNLDKIALELFGEPYKKYLNRGRK